LRVFRGLGDVHHQGRWGEAALSVTRLGAQPSIPARDEINRMLLRRE
jgi:sugar/nucleoside kinase (ribokinase family)